MKKFLALMVISAFSMVAFAQEKPAEAPKEGTKKKGKKKSATPPPAETEKKKP